MKKPRGFTLVELMVVVAIVAILSAILFSVAGRTYGGATAARVADQLAANLNFVRTRALATRRVHRVEIHPDTGQLLVYCAPTQGMALSNYTGSGSGSSVTVQGVMRIVIPNGVTISTVVQGAKGSGTSVTTSTAEYDLDFYPDGSSRPSDASANASTIFVSDKNPGAQKQYRVLVYHATGSAYAKQYW